MLLTLTPGVTYSFTFSTDFSARNGVYTLDKLSTYTEYLADGGNLYDEVFLPLNINPERMHQDMAQIESSKMMKLTTPDGIDNPVTIFMPTCYVDVNPDFNVDRYTKIGVVSYIGVTKDPALLEYVKDAIQNYILAGTGIDPETKFISIGNVWLTDKQYQDILSQRDQSKMKLINFYTENISLEKRISELQTKLATYEEIIKMQWKELHPDNTPGG